MEEVFYNKVKRAILKILPDKIYLKIKYKHKLGKKLNLKNPQTYNEKLQWLKLYDRKPMYTKMVDKYEAREYIAEKIGKEYLIPLIGVYDNFNDIDFESLPNQFVIKATHDSGSVIICKDKAKFNIGKAKEKIEKCLKYNFYYPGREWPYKNIKPRIVIEKYMEDESGFELKDYKFFCFNGKVKCLKIDFDRFTEHKANYYNRKFELLKFGETICPPDFNKKLEKPKKFDKMIELAEKLSKDITFLRVDFYEIDNKIYFGELTFFPASGFGSFEPKEYDNILGDWLKLDEEMYR